MIVIIDYGMGNLRSVEKAFEKVGAKAVITQNPDTIKNAQKLVLPGVGAMQPAMERLDGLGLIPIIKESVAAGKPFLGICLGFQLLFETSVEGGATQGLGILKGTVERFSQLKIPQIGWNQLNIKNVNSPLFTGISDQANVYFCHSYYVKPKNETITAATTDYGIEFTSSIYAGNILGTQFHPEKSQNVGLTILKNFNEMEGTLK